MKEILLHNIVFIGVGILLAVLGIAVKHWNARWLMAGFNSMSAEQRLKYDIEKIITLFRNITFLLAVIWIFLPIAGDLLNAWNAAMIATVVLHLYLCIHLVIVANSKKYKKDEINS